ncbi:Uncharacterized protein K02A2.6 [Stylophora pistillata]|uniref:Uncharacterized protein K02A2.6 n=1 Tax=Stylophora pistillata TaxID=50429 RepID=A0A2B4SZT8_STYPI|nr:Uncharacterized protein K02A2.6 [Stylophora pistillata]
MAGRPPFNEFDAETEDIESYLERLQEYFTAYDINDDEDNAAKRSEPGGEREYQDQSLEVPWAIPVRSDISGQPQVPPDAQEGVSAETDSAQDQKQDVTPAVTAEAPATAPPQSGICSPLKMTEAAEASIVVPPAPTQVFIPPSNLPPPKALNFDDNLATAWKSWKAAWQRYEIATGVYKQEGIVRVSTLLSIIGEDGVRAHDTFIWNEDENADDISQVLKKFDEFCIPRTQVIYERYRFNNRNQEPGENISTYLTELRTIAKNCAHDTITPDEILRDRLVLGIRDDRVRERLLRLNDLSLLQAVDIIKSSEQTQQQVKLMAGGDTAVHALRKAGSAEKPEEERQLKSQAFRRPSKECGNCGMVHGRHCPAYGRTCFNCGSMNHFANKCRANPRGVKSRVSAVHEAVDMGNDPYYIGATTSKSKGQEKLAVVKLHIYGPDPKTEVQFQIDTGSQCDILPAQLYKQITGDTLLHRLKPCQKEIVSYTGDRRKIAGKATLPVWSRGQRRSMEFNILDGDYQPILSLNTSLNLGFVSLHNCDVLALHVKCPKASLLEEYEDVFDGLGALPGAYKIAIDEQAQPVVHAPRRVPVALRPRIKNKLDELVDRKVIIPVTEPTQWVSSMLAIVKPNKRGNILQAPVVTIGGREIRTYLVGDSAYPQVPWLTKPFPEGTRDPEEQTFNKELSRARVTVERAFGILKSRWRVLQKRFDSPLEFAIKCTVACIELHNICVDQKDPWDEDGDDYDRANDDRNDDVMDDEDEIRDLLRDLVCGNI